MTSWITRLLLLLAAAPAAFAQPAPLVVGAVVSRTGMHADLAAGYGRALELWQDEVNAAGGLLGRKVELRQLDDGSEAVRAAQLYRQLIEEKADALIGPYGTAATLVAAAEAESAQRILINGAGWSRAVHKRKPRYVFQSAVPYNAYGTAVMELAARAGARSALILARDDDPAAVEMAAAALDAAGRLGIRAGAVQAYGRGIEDFAPQVAAARSGGIDAWVAFGQLRDAADMVKTLQRMEYAPKLFFARAASSAKLIPILGQAAEFSLGADAYDPRWATEGNARFVQAYTARWSASPSQAAAEGYAAATVLAEGLRRAGSAERQKLRAALAALKMQTVLGPFGVDPASGEQVEAAPALTQVLQGRAQPVWPPALKTSEPVLPYPAWKDRQLLAN